MCSVLLKLLPLHSRERDGERGVLKYDRSVGQFVPAPLVARVMGCQQARNTLDPAQHTLLEVSPAECALHFTADRFPAFRADPSMNTAIGDDFDVAIGQQ